MERPLYTNAEFAALEAAAVGAQGQALANALQVAGFDITAGQLQYLYTQGGNANFAYTGSIMLANSTAFEGCNGGGEGSACRIAGNPSVHWASTSPSGPVLHLDQGDPFFDFPLGLILHLGDLFGMINSSVPFGTGW